METSEKFATLDLDERYIAAKITFPDPNIYESTFEKEIYMAINLLRAKPKWFIYHIEKLREIVNERFVYIVD